MITSQSEWAYAVVLDGLPWTSSAKSVALEPGISLNRQEKGLSLIFPDYCAWEFDTVAWLAPPVEDRHFCTPASTMEVLIDVIVVMMESPLFGYRIVPFRKRLFPEDALQIKVIHDGGQTDFLTNHRELDDEALADIVKAWQTVAAIRKANGCRGRLSNALRLFQQAWKSTFMENTCLSLDLVFRTLVGRETSGKSDADVARAVTLLAESLGYDSDNTGEIVLRVLEVRAHIFSKGREDQDEVCDLGPEAFRLATSLLRRILLAKDVALAIDAIVIDE